MAQQLDRLTDQERHLLRLLARGHTAKTIANSEGLSINVVNERLRSARRKTGAVSSRELARLIGGHDELARQKNRNKFFDVEGTPSNDKPFQPSPAGGVGAKVVWGSAMVVGILVAVGIAAYFTSGTESPARKAQHFPVPVTGGDSTTREWRVMSASSTVPAITYLVPSTENSRVSIPTVVLSCRSVSLHVRVRGFTPENSWPQPPLTTRIGAAERMGSPEVNASGEKPALGYAFAIADEVLEPLAQGEAISFEFNGTTVAVPTIPEEMREQFVERCGGLVHPGMRRRGAASDRVY
ncbi:MULTISPECIES: helix-turn-helix transcriptional regulator [Brevundimonas]|uniref:helix-turn-helix transcriptional regulator n=1 Tax=Brevundimonas TaxID=41275 RepID=UPI00190F753F|nr:MULTISPECIES: helix-turn-helix transcriptional regulator [Brevundimonas]